MFNKKGLIRLLGLISIICWLALLLSSFNYLFGRWMEQSSQNIPKVFLALFFVCLILFYQNRIKRVEQTNFVDTLWKVFVTGLIATIVSLIISSFLSFFRDNKLSQNVLLINFFYNINIGLVSAFLISTYVAWKRLILYQYSKWLFRFWRFFEYALWITIILNLLDIKFLDNYFRIIFFGIMVLALVPLINLKWVAYLNFGQKWKSLLLIGIVISYLIYFSIHLVDYSSKYRLVINLIDNVFVIALFTFILLYAIISFLVILFNLPTSSVFEQKLEEVVSFQRLSQSLQHGQKEEDVYAILLKSSISATNADAGWLEVNSMNEDACITVNEGFKNGQLHAIKEKIEQVKGIKQLSQIQSLGEVNKHKLSFSIKDNRYRSILRYPLFVKAKLSGWMVLVKGVSVGFNNDMLEMVKAFTNQAYISIENHHLIQETLANERYKEELKIAQKVQRSLLPQSLTHNEDLDIAAFSDTAYEVGGDYYDTYRIDEDRMALIVSDVSGKGTSAAFQMSQLKGIFHSYAQLALDPHEFFTQANLALSRSLDKSSFITSSYYIIDQKNKEITFARAGHCPTLYYSNDQKKADYLKNKGLALGVLRNPSYKNYVHVNNLHYKNGDVIVLYTDGITEAQLQGEEFGYERLKDVVEKNASLNAQEIQNEIIKALFQFCDTECLDDDFTVLVLKFNVNENVSK